jgi:hypothetical protein
VLCDNDAAHRLQTLVTAMKSRNLCFVLLPAATLLLTAPAFAAEPCDGDAWFCDEQRAGSSEPAPSAAPEAKASKAEASAPASPPEPFVIQSSSESSSAPATVETPSRRAGGDAPTRSRKRANGKDRERHFGFNLRLASLLMEEDKTTHPDAGMSGLGVGLRFMPAPFVALEPGIDGLGGRDELGRQRSETTLSFNTIFFLNPDDPVLIYGLLGVFTTSAEVKGTEAAPVAHGGRFSYVGGQVGAGIELRLGPALAFNCELLGYARQRNELPGPEETSKELRRDSGGGIVRGGMSLYF